MAAKPKPRTSVVIPPVNDNVAIERVPIGGEADRHARVSCRRDHLTAAERQRVAGEEVTDLPGAPGDPLVPFVPGGPCGPVTFQSRACSVGAAPTAVLHA